MEMRVGDDPSAAAAAWMAQRIRDAVDQRGEALIAVSGGGTAPPFFEALLANDVPWDATSIWQVDERVAPDGHEERNAGQLVALPARTHLMPVTADDLDVAAADYGASVPGRFDVVHLGLGDDGHTASWPPGHGVADSDRPCEVIGEFNGFRRMTLTPPVVNSARARLMLTLGATKAPLLARWLEQDPDLPVSRVDHTDTWVFLDRDAASELPPDVACTEPESR